MAVVIRTRTFINYPAIAALNLPTGDIGRWADNLMDEARLASISVLEAKPPAAQGPWVRTGALAATIRGERTGSNQFGINLALEAGSSDVNYAGYVHEGTTGPITAGGKLMPVGVPGQSQGALHQNHEGGLARRVAGQTGYPFLTMGMNVILPRHELRPMTR